MSATCELNNPHVVTVGRKWAIVGICGKQMGKHYNICATNGQFVQQKTTITIHWCPWQHANNKQTVVTICSKKWTIFKNVSNDKKSGFTSVCCGLGNGFWFWVHSSYLQLDYLFSWKCIKVLHAAPLMCFQKMHGLIIVNRSAPKTTCKIQVQLRCTKTQTWPNIVIYPLICFLYKNSPAGFHPPFKILC